LVDASLTYSYVRFVQMLKLGPNMLMIYNRIAFQNWIQFFQPCFKYLQCCKKICKWSLANLQTFKIRCKTQNNGKCNRYIVRGYEFSFISPHEARFHKIGPLVISKLTHLNCQLSKWYQFLCNIVMNWMLSYTQIDECLLCF
jgi:hypothetical protein